MRSLVWIVVVLLVAAEARRKGGSTFSFLQAEVEGGAGEPTEVTADSNSEAKAGSNEHLGIANLGNTCYLNTVLQALFHIPAFKYGVLKVKESDMGMDLVTEGVKKAFTAMDPKEPVPSKDQMDAFVNTLSNHCDAFGCNWRKARMLEQNQPGDFLTFLLDEMNTEAELLQDAALKNLVSPPFLSRILISVKSPDKFAKDAWEALSTFQSWDALKAVFAKVEHSYEKQVTLVVINTMNEMKESPDFSETKMETFITAWSAYFGEKRYDSPLAIAKKLIQVIYQEGVEEVRSLYKKLPNIFEQRKKEKKLENMSKTFTSLQKTDQCSSIRSCLEQQAPSTRGVFFPFNPEPSETLVVEVDRLGSGGLKETSFVRNSPKVCSRGIFDNEGEHGHVWYDLVTGVYHLGDAHAGHYIASTVDTEDGKWQVMDDEKTTVYGDGGKPPLSARPDEKIGTESVLVYKRSDSKC